MDGLEEAITKYVTPALAMNGKVLSAGKVLDPDQIKALIQKERAAKIEAH